MSFTPLRSLSATFQTKDDERNLFSAALHIMSITLISMSLVDLGWFNISGTVCVPYLTVGEFFWFGYTKTSLKVAEFNCINSTIVNLMRFIIFLNFMAIIFACSGFLLDIIAPKMFMFRMWRKYGVSGSCTIFWVISTVTASYNVIVLLQRYIDTKYPREDAMVTYGLGFYLLTAAGAIEGINLLITLLLPSKSSYNDDDHCLIDDLGVEGFHSRTPPPPYSLAPPPYTP